MYTGGGGVLVYKTTPPVYTERGPIHRTAAHEITMETQHGVYIQGSQARDLGEQNGPCRRCQLQSSRIRKRDH